VNDGRRSARSVRTTALWLAAIAIVFYLGFIFLGAIRA
jgi:fatty acid desaturase